MASRALLLLFIAAATTVAGCREDPLGPLPGSTLLRDEGDPECVDTVYVDTSEASETGAESEDDHCHVVVIQY